MLKKDPFVAWISTDNEILRRLLWIISISADNSLVPITEEEFRVWLGAVRIEPKKEEHSN
jgi:hypothetical protein